MAKLQNLLKKSKDLLWNKSPSDDSRQQQLVSELNIEQTPQDLKSKVLNLCNKYHDVFALKTDNLTCNNFYKQKNNLTDSSPVNIKNYRLPEIHREEI